ncbi:unnamed protein product [Neospora caninum Liverpool]|uniref:Rhoptry kinase family protein ROP17, putative n=1 Tax=Neospora caninum (strain Liverpool) TaxID=572307 RepID=F0VH10_NEOCL|nr:uncharacterized protein NCLIV_027930 [Neospora caninum Liverpool]CBZ53004.1 unnamed protein product [Neospora caninum Liverpool]CEL66989.1 TPA: Rhoptry kinase family protein ROP17, putative [Neospora caninum Liverpool]|eukprot:XP_003883036.1 uncharacterized protein NCLIV_027930 [Neospora caninum Liverpool]
MPLSRFSVPAASRTADQMARCHQAWLNLAGGMTVCFLIVTISCLYLESSALPLRSRAKNDVFGGLEASAHRTQPRAGGATHLPQRGTTSHFHSRGKPSWRNHGYASWSNNYTLLTEETAIGSQHLARPTGLSLIENPGDIHDEGDAVAGAREERDVDAHLHPEDGAPFDRLALQGEGPLNRHPQAQTGPARSGLRTRIKQNVGRLWRVGKRALQKLGQRAKQRIGEFVARHVRPRLARLRFWDAGRPPVVPPLKGNEPGQADVALVAARMQAGVRQKAFREKNLTEAEKIIGSYLISSAEKTWFSTVPGGRPIVLIKRGFIGGGGFGLVYHVEHPGTRQAYALKAFIRDDRSGMPLEGLSASIEEEFDVTNGFPPEWTPLRIYSELRFMVPILKLRVQGKPDFQDVRRHFRVASTCALFPKAQGDLGELVRLLKDVDSDTAFRVRMSSTIQMVKLLARFHSFGLVHGDVKLQNFLVEQSGLLLLSDFTKIIRGNSNYFPPVVTAAYMSPEMATCLVNRLRDDIAYTSRTDSWMLGISVYKLWCGAYPFGIKASSRLTEVAGILLRVHTSLPDFSRCHHIPRQFRDMVRGFLRKSSVLRLDPQQALEDIPLLQWTG